MKLNFKLSSYFVDKPNLKTIDVNPEDNAVQLPTGEILKIKQLKGEALDQYVYEKYVRGSIMDGRVIEYYIST